LSEESRISRDDIARTRQSKRPGRKRKRIRRVPRYLKVRFVRARLWRARLLRHLLLGLPALVAAVGVCLVAARAAKIKPDRLGSYIEQSERDFKAKNFRAALVGFERLAEEGDVAPEVDYKLAVCLSIEGEHDRAEAIIDLLAPEGGMGLMEAHMWKVRRLLLGEVPTPATLNAAEAHLKYVLTRNAEWVEPNARLGMLYLTSGRTDKAVPHLEKAARVLPELLMVLARLAAARGDQPWAKTRANEARRAFERRATANLDDHDSRLQWAECTLFLREYAETLSILQRGIALKGGGGDERYLKALGQTYLGWADSLDLSPGVVKADRLMLLKQGLLSDPSNLPLIDRFTRLVRAGGPEGERARATMRELLPQGQGQGRAQAPANFVLSLDAWEHGRSSEALAYNEEAYRLAPQSTPYANNLAYLLATGPKPDLPRALGIINKAIAADPDRPQFRETRGQILVRLGRWDEALPDLESALTAFPDDAGTHQALAETYEHLGKLDKAAAHRRRTAPAPLGKPK
jgi:tetratricopeptide (TPR) repeat protein